MPRPLLLTVLGARPQFIKAAVVSHALAADGRLDERLVHTGQHYDHGMSQVFFDELGIPAPEVNLGVGSGPHGAQTARMLEGLEALLLERQPAAVLIYGDTNSTLAAALAAAKLHIPVAHVEAGLRSFNLRMPEEVNRLVADRVAARCYTPSPLADENLRREGIPEDAICRVGDVMLDAARRYGAAAGPSPVADLPARYALVTIHRAENTDAPDRLATIAAALRRLAEAMPVLFAVHPRTAAALARQALALGGVRTIPPQGYVAMARLERGAAVILTDSGGVQKEAFYHGVPSVTVRDETEWAELLPSGWNRLAPPVSVETLLEAVAAALAARPAPMPGLFGDGRAGERIAADLAARFAT